MVRVSFNLGKRDFIWIGIIIVLVGVGFGYAYDSGLDPDVMGHSSDEIEFRKIAALGAESKYGALTVEGIKNNWGGINFKDGLTNLGTLMVRDDIQGFYNDADSGWDWYFRNGVLTVGTVPWARISGAPATPSVGIKVYLCPTYNVGGGVCSRGGVSTCNGDITTRTTCTGSCWVGGSYVSATKTCTYVGRLLSK